MGKEKKIFREWCSHGDGSTAKWFRSLIKKSKSSGRSAIIVNPSEKFGKWRQVNGHASSSMNGEEESTINQSANKILSDFGFPYSTEKKGYILKIESVRLVRSIMKEHDTEKAAAESVILAMGETKKEANRVAAIESRKIDRKVERLEGELDNLRRIIGELKNENNELNRRLREYQRGEAIEPPREGIKEEKLREAEESVSKATEMNEEIEKDVEDLPERVSEEVNIEDVDKVQKSITTTPPRNLLDEIQKGTKLRPVARRGEREPVTKGRGGMEASLQENIMEAIKKRRKAIEGTNSESRLTQQKNSNASVQPETSGAEITQIERRWHNERAVRALEMFRREFSPGSPDWVKKGAVVWYKREHMKSLGGLKGVIIEDRDKLCCGVMLKWESYEYYTKEVILKAREFGGETIRLDPENETIYGYGLTVREAICRVYYLRMVLNNNMILEVAKVQCEERVRKLEIEYKRSLPSIPEREEERVKVHPILVMILSSLNSEKCGGKGKKGKKKGKKWRMSRNDAKKILRNGMINGRQITEEERETLKKIAYRRR